MGAETKVTDAVAQASKTVKVRSVFSSPVVCSVARTVN